MSQEAIQEKLTEFQLLKQEIEQIQQQTQIINQQLQEFKKIKLSLDEIKKTKQATKILVPLGAGIYVHASLTNPQDVMMNVGSDVSVPKKIPEAMKLIDSQVEELKNILVEFETQSQQAMMKAASLQAEIQELSTKKQ